MAKRKGPAADARLAKAWGLVHAHASRGHAHLLHRLHKQQRIIHCIAAPRSLAMLLAATRPYQLWEVYGHRATPEVFQALIESSAN